MAVYNLPTGFDDRMSINISYSQEVRNRIVDFGDGYTQRTPLGINPRIRRLDVVWENLTQSERDTLLMTLDYVSQTGDAIFIAANELLWTNGKYYVETIDVQMADHNKVTISASLREVFDL